MMKMSGQKILCMTLMAAWLAAAGGQNAYAETEKSQEIPQGVSVNGIDLGGMDVENAEACLDQFVQDTCAGNLVLTIDGEEIEIPYADFDMHVADSTIIQEICEIGSSGNLIKRYKELADVKNNKAEYQLTFEYDHDKLKELVAEMTETYNREAEDATLVRHSGQFIITDAVTGLEVDTDATVKTIEAALNEEWDGSEEKLAVSVTETQPEHTREELEVITDLLGSYSTNYSSSSNNRIANIANGASLIDETVIYPGETFSFLEHVVPFTAANGYYEATGYSGGKVVPSIGGGICQVSSTLYDAVLRAELEIVERSNHGLTVGYVPLGADATVSEGSVDFKFKNNLDDAVYLEAYTYSGNVYVCIYGKETRPSNRTIEFYSVTEQTIEPGDDVITEDDTQPEGYQEVTQTAHNGYVASFYKYVYVDGELQEKIKLNTSTYRATPRYVTVGTKKEKETEKVSDDEEQD
jgi:vancomycin resistance protein YoaR